MTATVTLRQPGSAGTHFDEDLGHTVSDPYEPYAVDVLARIRPIGSTLEGGPGTNVVGDLVRVTGYGIGVPRSFDGDDDPAFGVNTLVEVTTCDDPELVGRTLTVSDVVRGTDHFHRELIASLND